MRTHPYPPSLLTDRSCTDNKLKKWKFHLIYLESCAASKWASDRTGWGATLEKHRSCRYTPVFPGYFCHSASLLFFHQSMGSLWALVPAVPFDQLCLLLPCYNPHQTPSRWLMQHLHFSTRSEMCPAQNCISFYCTNLCSLKLVSLFHCLCSSCGMMEMRYQATGRGNHMSYFLKLQSTAGCRERAKHCWESQSIHSASAIATVCQVFGSMLLWHCASLKNITAYFPVSYIMEGQIQLSCVWRFSVTCQSSAEKHDWQDQELRPGATVGVVGVSLSIKRELDQSQMESFQ